MDRMLHSEHYEYLVDYQDDVWSFFQNCWHLKDWVKHDPLVTPEVKERIRDAVHASRMLAIANDMANGTKHLKLDEPRAPAAHYHIQIITSGSESRLECVVEVDGLPMFASIIAKKCVEDWERILKAEGLPTEPMGT